VPTVNARIAPARRVHAAIRANAKPASVVLAAVLTASAAKAKTAALKPAPAVKRPLNK